MFSSISPDHIAVLIPVVAVLGGICIAITGIIAGGRKKELEHKERLVAIEKGIPLPEPEQEVKKPVHSGRRAGGLVMFGLGLALTIALRFTPDAEHAWGWGLIPLFVGVGLIIAAILDKREYEERIARKQSDTDKPAVY
jgi:hypothetical protein